MPEDVDVRRAISAAYYAVFHRLCECFSEIVLHPPGRIFERAHNQAYRSLEHGVVKSRCRDATSARWPNFPDEIKAFAVDFVDLQQKRCEADYNPSAAFTSADALKTIDDAENALDRFDSASMEEQRAFAIFVAMKGALRLP